MHLTANISVPQKNFIAIDLHFDARSHLRASKCTQQSR